MYCLKWENRIKMLGIYLNVRNMLNILYFILNNSNESHARNNASAEKIYCRLQPLKFSEL